MTRLLAEQPAKLFGMFPQKGCLAVGSDADVVIFDDNYTGRISATEQTQNVDYTPYEGFAVLGRAEIVFLSGRVVVADGKLIAPCQGAYVHRNASRLWR